MQIKRFEAQDMTEALRMIKKEFGPEAVILSARSMKKENGIFSLMKKGGVEVTAAIDSHYPENMTVASLPNEDWRRHKKQHIDSRIGGFAMKRELIRPSRRSLGVSKNRRKNRIENKYSIGSQSDKFITLQHRMISQGVEPEIALDLLGKLNSSVDLMNILEKEGPKECLAGIFEKIGISVGPVDKKSGRQKILTFIGPTGVGKTTTIAKLASVLSIHDGNDVGLISMDSYRLGAIEQLNVYAGIIGIPLSIASDNRQLKIALKNFKNKDIVLIDTPGMSHKNKYQISKLETALDEGVRWANVHLVLSAVTKNGDLEGILKAFKCLAINRLVFTKLDETVEYGNIINQIVRTKIPVSYFTTGQDIPEDIEVASLDRMSEMMLNQRSDNNYDLGQWNKLPHKGGGRELRGQSVNNYYMANINSDVFHNPACTSAKKIKKDNAIIFENIEDAIIRGFKPCRLCNPDRDRETDLYQDTEAINKISSCAY